MTHSVVLCRGGRPSTRIEKSPNSATKYTPLFFPSIPAGVPAWKRAASLSWMERAATVRPSHKRLSIYYIKEPPMYDFFSPKQIEWQWKKRHQAPKPEWKVYNSISSNVISSNFSLYSQSTGDSFNLLSGCSNLLILTSFNLHCQTLKILWSWNHQVINLSLMVAVSNVLFETNNFFIENMIVSFYIWMKTL